MDLLIRGGRIFDPSSRLNTIKDILVENGLIVVISEEIRQPKGTQILDAQGLYIFPGFIDAHVHFRTPGEERKESYETGCAAALAGGFTTVIQMPNTNPPLSSPELVEKYTRDEPLHTRVMASITKNRAGEELNDLQALSDAGAVAFSDDGSSVLRDDIMEQALVLSKKLGKRIASHCENPEYSSGGAVIDGDVAKKLGVKGIDRKAEWSMVERDIELARKTGGLLHICHVSTAKSVELIEKAKKDGVNVTCEATPHHLLLNHEAVLKLGTNAKMNPPLAYEEDRIALVDALKRGVIDIIATDHAPHTVEDKSKGLADAPFGVVGLETAFPMLFSKLVPHGYIYIEMLITLMTSAPARCFNLEGGSIGIGKPADFCLVNLDEEYVVDSSKFRSKGRNTPFEGWKVKGKINTVIVGGIVEYTLVS